MANNVIALKLLNLPTPMLGRGLSNLYPLTDAISVITLRPSFELVKHKVPEGSGSTPDKSPLVTVNLVFDANESKITHHSRGIDLAESRLARVPASHFDSYDALSNFVLAVGLPSVKLPEDFWIPVHAVLTRREMEILHHVYGGQSSKQIAEILTVSPRTIELHRQNCSGKLGPLTPRLLGALFSTDILETYDWCTTEQATGFNGRHWRSNV